MPVHYGRFEMPKTLVKEEHGATEIYARFVAEPFEAGYGHTVGNSLRRVLLSSLEGAAITAVENTGVPHEFATPSGGGGGELDIVLNILKAEFKNQDNETEKLAFTLGKDGSAPAAATSTKT